MTEPLNDPIEVLMIDFFTKEAVDKFLNNAASIEENDLRYYNQLNAKLKDSAIRFTLSKFKIPIQTRVTVYGGFTGQFAESLKVAGMSVVFTDPIQHWVKQAKKMGMESYKFTVQEIPRELIKRTDLFASFECYPDLIGKSNFYYPIMRLLTVKYGILFVESTETVSSMRKENPGYKEQELGTFRRWFRPLYHVYGIQRKATKTEYLNFYNIVAGPEAKKTLIDDCRFMKAVHDTFESGHNVVRSDIFSLAVKANLDNSLAERSFDRMCKLSDSINAPDFKMFPFLASSYKGDLKIGSKQFKFLID